MALTLKFETAHISTKWSAEPEVFKREQNEVRSSGSIVTYTEMADDRRRRLLGSPHWGMARSPQDDGSDECAIEWRRELWTPTDEPRFIKLSNKRFKRPSGRLSKPVHLAYVQLQSQKIEQVKVDVIVAHLPQFDEPGREPIWRDCMEGYLEFVSELKKENPRRFIIARADWNMNYRDEYERTVLNNYWHKVGLRPGWEHELPRNGGTHGRQIIDGDYLLNLKVESCRLLPDAVKGDHRGFRTVYKAVLK